MRESVPSARYSHVCNVLRQWKTSLILTYSIDTIPRYWKLDHVSAYARTFVLSQTSFVLEVLFSRESGCRERIFLPCFSAWCDYRRVPGTFCLLSSCALLFYSGYVVVLIIVLAK